MFRPLSAIFSSTISFIWIVLQVMPTAASKWKDVPEDDFLEVETY
jgi:hypothetical protein